MKQFGIIKEDGKIKGFKMPEHDVHKRQYAERELKQKLTKGQLKLADHALEFRARWLHESVGYGDSSCNIKEGDRLPADSRIPIGCEIPEIVAKAIATLNQMASSNARSKHHVYILNMVYLNRRNDESIKSVIGRMGVDFSERQFRYAKEVFARAMSK